MKTIQPLTAACGLPSFEWASFTFPKYVFTLPTGPMAKRLSRAKDQCTGPYFHAPTPNQTDGKGFYLASDGMPGLRWTWADDVISLGHRGWYCDEFQDSTIRGVVFRLPRGRGFLAGWSMGESMASAMSYTIHDTAKEAARAADEEARIAAEREREHEERERERERAEEQNALEIAAEEVSTL